VTASLRNLGAVLAAGLAGAIALGAALAVAQDASVLRWIAYMLYVAGALVLGFGFLTGTPPSPRKLAKQRTIDRAQARFEGRDPDTVPELVQEKPFLSELAVLAVAGTLLFAVGILIELAL
jgi:hypothetical protein